MKVLHSNTMLNQMKKRKTTLINCPPFYTSGEFLFLETVTPETVTAFNI